MKPDANRHIAHSKQKTRGMNVNASATRKGVPDLLAIARLAMTSRGLEPDIPNEALLELAGISTSAVDNSLADLTQLLWCSIDNDDSMDLDQITVAEEQPNGTTKILIGIADVDAIVKRGGPIDQHAQKNTTSVYTGVKIFPMLPEKLSTNLTSFSPEEQRLALVVEMLVGIDGEITASHIYQARVRNRAKLAYDGVSDWLDGKHSLPVAARNVPGLDKQLRIQDKVAQQLRHLRNTHGALELDTLEPRAIMVDGAVANLKQDEKNRARELIEDFMIAANGVTARFLAQANFPVLQRVVRVPKRWDRIVQVAAAFGEKLPRDPDSGALSSFLSKRRISDPLRFPDLSLTIVKLLGRGEYILTSPGVPPIGHFGLAVRNYSHSTAPNRRFPDLITQRLLKAVMKHAPAPYDQTELRLLASHCTAQENAADRVERQVRKSASALLLSTRVGHYFDGIVTGASEKGTWARVFEPPVEGKIVHGESGLDVGDRIRLKLIGVNVEKGFIDFVRIP